MRADQVTWLDLPLSLRVRFAFTRHVDGIAIHLVEAGHERLGFLIWRLFRLIK
jgi:hypothetical protein